MPELRTVLERLHREIRPETDAATGLCALRTLKRRRSVRRRLAAGIVASLVGISGTLIAIRALDLEPEAKREPASPVIDPRVVTSFPVGPRGQVTGIAAGFGSLWITAYGVDGGDGLDDAALLRIDPSTNSVADVVPLEGVSGWETGGGGVTVGSDAVWVAGHLTGGGDTESALYRVDPSSLEVEGMLLYGDVAAADVAVSGDDVWVTGRHDGVPTLTHVDARFDKVDAPEVSLRGEYVRQVVATDLAVIVRQWEWEGHEGPCDVVTSIDPDTIQKTAQQPRGDPCTGPGAGSLFVWKGQVWTSTEAGFSQMDPSTAGLTGSMVPFSKDDAFPRSAPVVGATGVWFGAYPGGNGSAPDRLSRLDPTSGTIETFDLDVGWSAATVLDGSIWALGWDGTLTRIELFPGTAASGDVSVSMDLEKEPGVRCTATISSTYAPGDEVAVRYTLENIGTDAAEVTVMPPSYSFSVRDANGTEWDTAELMLHSWPYVEPIRLKPGAARDLEGTRLRVQFPGPVVIVPRCAGEEMAGLTAEVVAGGPPISDAQAVERAAAATGGLLDGCRPPADGSSVGEVVSPAGERLEIRCSASVSDAPGFSVVTFVLSTPVSAEVSPISPGVVIGPELTIEQPNAVGSENSQVILWRFVVTETEVIPVAAAIHARTAPANAMTTEYAVSASGWTQDGGSRCGGESLSSGDDGEQARIVFSGTCD